jgi:hypothetical protein
MTALDALLSQDDIAGLIVIQTLQTMTETMLDAEAVIKARKKRGIHVTAAQEI